MFFADRYPAWQRGNNENANGLSRQGLSHSMDFSTITDGDLRRANSAFTTASRKRPGFKTPSGASTRDQSTLFFESELN